MVKKTTYKLNIDKTVEIINHRKTNLKYDNSQTDRSFQKVTKSHNITHTET